ncbi:polysaccharide pyruvyl transferase family protein [Capnocytophaga granulosa]|mgnify:CR=1 FL=1|jgi:polysaccharide pyruvyl transferase|uniref:polysaccharide pyruvyl transferase family protein n=1 Tax=Capnocytophaga granulosa TaxID=45242 RepID=UPI0023F34B42|nr:polysaccharide pyruvyl transferase family protein [Capnocytophaga granulosa]
MNNKYCLTGCYTDYNRGDLGIIISTIKYIKNNDPNAEIIGVSDYNYSDPLFHTEHSELKEYITVYPSIFGELNIGNNKTILAKILRFLWDTFRLLLLILFPFDFIKRVLLSQHEFMTLKQIKTSNFIVSKGGSFICNSKNIREKLALFRYLYQFFFIISMKKKMIILFQSIGPIHGFFSRVYVNILLRKCYRVVIRENICKELYRYIKYPNNLIISNDIAFIMPMDKKELNIINEENFNIGITIKYVSNAESYTKMMKSIIEYSLNNFSNSRIYLFTQVPFDNDMEATWEIFKMIEDKYKNKIFLLTEKYTPTNLKYLYSKMDMFIGTRLHSTIFSLGANVPSIAIAYHGTKAQGIFNNMGLNKYVMEDYDTEKLINLTQDLYKNHKEIKNKIEKKLSFWEQEFNIIFQKIFS